MSSLHSKEYILRCNGFLISSFSWGFVTKCKMEPSLHIDCWLVWHHFWSISHSHLLEMWPKSYSRSSLSSKVIPSIQGILSFFISTWCWFVWRGSQVVWIQICGTFRGKADLSLAQEEWEYINQILLGERYLLVSLFSDKFSGWLHSLQNEMANFNQKVSFVFKYIYLSPFGKYSDLIFTPLH